MHGAGKTLLLAAVLAVASVGTVYTAPAQARVSVSIYAPMAPPPLRVEPVPRLRAGYVWAPGYWRWHNHRYVWNRGRPLRARHGYRYAPPHWLRDGNRWRYYGESWSR